MILALPPILRNATHILKFTESGFDSCGSARSFISTVPASSRACFFSTTMLRKKRAKQHQDHLTKFHVISNVHVHHTAFQILLCSFRHRKHIHNVFFFTSFSVSKWLFVLSVTFFLRYGVLTPPPDTSLPQENISSQSKPSSSEYRLKTELLFLAGSAQ